MNKKKLIGKAALLLSLPMLISSVKGLEASFASDEVVNVKQAEKDSTNTEGSTKDEKKKENQAKYKVITRLEGLTNGKSYYVEKVEVKEGEIGTVAFNDDPQTYPGFEVVKGDKDKTIDRDGNTVVNLYYDRIKYKLTIMELKDDNQWKKGLTVPLKYGESTEKALDELLKERNGNIKEGLVVSDSNGTVNNIYTGPPNMKDQDLILYVKRGGNTKYTTSHLDEADGSIHADTYFYAGGGNIDYTEKDAIVIPGYTAKNGQKGKFEKTSNYWGKIVYEKNKYTIRFVTFNGEDVVIEKKYRDEIGMSDEGTNLQKDITTKIVNGKTYKFEGWYDNPEYNKTIETGEDYNLAGQKMPAHNMIFFAKWTPINGDTEEEPELQDDPNAGIIQGEEKGPDAPIIPPEEPKTPEEDESPSVPKDEEKEPNVDTDTEEGKEGTEEDKDTETNPSPVPTPDVEGEDKPESDLKVPDEDKKPEEDKDDSEGEKIEEIPEKDDSKEEPEENSKEDKEEPQEDQEEDSDGEVEDSEDAEEGESEDLEEDEEAEDPDEEDDTEEELDEEEDLEEDESDDEEDSEEKDEEDIEPEIPDENVEYSSLEKVESIGLDNPTIKIKAGLQKTLKLIFKDKDGKIINVKTSSLTVTDVKGEDNNTVDKELLDAGNHSLDAKLVELAILGDGLKSGEYTISIKIKDDTGVEKPFDLKIRLYKESQPWEDIKPIEPKEEDSKEDNSSDDNDKEQSPEKDKNSDSQNDDPNNDPDGSEKQDSHKEQSPKEDSKKDDNQKEDSSKKSEKNRRLYERLKMALERYKKAIENLKKYRQRYITKTNKDKEFIEKMDTLLEQSDSLIKRADRLLEILKRS